MHPTITAEPKGSVPKTATAESGLQAGNNNNTKGINEAHKVYAGKISTNKTCVAEDSYSHFTKSSGIILDSVSWPHRCEEQDVLHKTHNADRRNFNN